MVKTRQLKILLTGCSSRATVMNLGTAILLLSEHKSELLVDPIFNRMRAATRSLPGFGIRTLNSDQ